MEITTIVKQLEALSGSIVQTLTVLESLYSSSSSSSDGDRNSSQGLVHDTKFEIFEGIVLLNQILHSHPFGSTTLFPGSLVLAPRFFEGNMCLDLAIVILIKCATNDTEKFISIDSHSLAISTTESDIYVKNSNQNFKVVWLRPHSRYELLSHSITFSDSQLDITNISNTLQEQQNFIQKLSAGDIVLFISLLNDCHYGTWRKGTVQKITNGGEYVQIEPIIKNNSSSNESIGSLLLPLKITFVAPLPITKGFTKSTNHREESLLRRTGGLVDEADIFSDDSDDNENDDDEIHSHEGITSIPSLYGAMLQNNLASSLPVHQSQSQVLGLWQKHTKGFGGRILAKMGFVSGGPGGLGKRGQGIVQPVQLAETPRLTATGLGLVQAKRPREEDEDGRGEDQQKRHRMVQDFNERLLRRKSSTGGSSSSQKKNKNKPPQREEQEPTCVFNFLNSLEVKPNPSIRKESLPNQPPPAAKLSRPSKHVF